MEPMIFDFDVSEKRFNEMLNAKKGTLYNYMSPLAFIKGSIFRINKSIDFEVKGNYRHLFKDEYSIELEKI